MMRHISLAVLWALLAARACQSFPQNVALTAKVTASSAATPTGGKYAAECANDGDAGTHWASANSNLPQWLRLEWVEPQDIDTILVDIFAADAATIYAPWKTVEVELSDSAKQRVGVDQPWAATALIRFPESHRVTWLRVTVVEVYEMKTYIGANEIAVYADPLRLVGPRREVVRPKPREAIAIKGQAEHPVVYINKADLERGRRNATTTEWGAEEKRNVLAEAEKWLSHEEPYWVQFLPPPGACYAYGFVACPTCDASWGTWGGARCSWDKPGKVTCVKGHETPDKDHPDDGTGWVGPDKRIHYIVGTWNAWVTEQWTLSAIPSLCHAYALTKEEKYAERAAFFLDALASTYAESTSGSWDYPSSPPSGRFARPWYQVSRNLVPFVEAYDLIYSSPALLEPSLRPALESKFPKGPTLQQRAVGTPDEHGLSWPGMTRRDNINKNLMENAAYYCYSHTFGGMLHNGHADYMRGALAVGVLLGMPEYVHNAVESPYSIYAMLANNVDRDGRYYETALGYALHTRDLYLTFVEPLLHWRDDEHPNGVNLFDDPRMRAFYRLPSLSLNLCGHSPNFGDAGPDNRYVAPLARPFDANDYMYAEHLHAGCSGEAKAEFAGLLSFLSDGDVERQRKAAGSKRWLLYHADAVPKDQPKELPPDLQRQVYGSWFLGQKGMALLRDGSGANAQGILLRYGPSLNHGDLDDLGLIYYGKGWQLTYEIGYGLASTHTQVGWGSQTASHALVTVNEKSQSGGSGGSLYLFARLPGFKVVEADSPLSYAKEKVSQYRRTVALVGAGKDQVLVDLFRVRGGAQHDYIVGGQSQDFAVGGVDLGPEEEGSLAGREYAWGERQGPEGDIIGYPNKPYWNPPPGNGYGFFYDARRGKTNKRWYMDWALGGPNSAHLRVHLLPEGEDEALAAKAPGLYPFNRRAAYLLSRRHGMDLSSCFAAVMEPYAAQDLPAGVTHEALARMMVESSGETKLLPDYSVLLLKGSKPGDDMTFSVPVKEAATYVVAARLLQAPSYGTVSLLVDGKPLGKPFAATAEAIRGPELVRFGEMELAAGQHSFRFEVTSDQPRYYMSIASLHVIPSGQANSLAAAPKPVLSQVERLTVEGMSAFPAAAVHFRRGNLDEYIVSAEASDKELAVNTVAGPLRWNGAAVYVAARGNEVVKLAVHDVSRLSVGGCVLEPEVAAFEGRLRTIDYEARWIETSAKLPVHGLDGEGVYFTNPRYSRNTAYRIHHLEALKGGSRIHLGSQPMLLGHGRVHQVTAEDTVLSDIPHDYGRSVIGGNNPRFFDGKLLRASSGAATQIKQVLYSTPMQITVDSAKDFRDGDALFYYDVQEGDAFRIPTSVWVSREGAREWRGVATVNARLTVKGRVINIPGKGL